MKRILFLLAFVLVSCGPMRTYEVKITYCDERAPEIVTVQSRSIPSHSDLCCHSAKYVEYNNKRYYNVCDVQTLRDIDSGPVKSYK